MVMTINQTQVSVLLELVKGQNCPHQHPHTHTHIVHFSQDFIIFAGDAEMKRVPQCTTGRVFLLKFRDSTTRRFFYWLQEPKEEKDEDLLKKVWRKGRGWIKEQVDREGSGHKMSRLNFPTSRWMIWLPIPRTPQQGMEEDTCTDCRKHSLVSSRTRWV